MELAHPWKVEWGRREKEGEGVKKTKEREQKRERERSHINKNGTCGGETVPCSRTPPFFLKRGLPDHNGGLERKDKERGRERDRERERTGQSFDLAAAAR